MPPTVPQSAGMFALFSTPSAPIPGSVQPTAPGPVVPPPLPGAASTTPAATGTPAATFDYDKVRNQIANVAQSMGQKLAGMFDGLKSKGTSGATRTAATAPVPVALVAGSIYADPTRPVSAPRFGRARPRPLCHDARGRVEHLLGPFPHGEWTQVRDAGGGVLPIGLYTDRPDHVFVAWY